MAKATAEEIRAGLNKTLKSPVASMASDEVYRRGQWPTGLLPIDILTNGGWAKGRFGLLAGESQTLKSYIILCTIAQVQKAGGTAMYIDVEHSLDQEWAERIGINTSELLLIQPETGEVAIDSMEYGLRNEIDYIGLDSIAALVPKSEQELQMSGNSNNQPARIAALMSLGLRKLNAANKQSTVTWVTQMRADIGAMPFAPKTIRTGGKSIIFYASQILDVKKTFQVKEDISYWGGDKNVSDKRVVGQGYRVELSKSRIGRPFDLAHFQFNLQTGEIDMPAFLITEGMARGIIVKDGAKWTITVTDNNGEVTLDHEEKSREKFQNWFGETVEVQKTLTDMICKDHGLDPANYG